MRRLWTWANRITVLRIALVFFLVFLVYNQGFWTRLFAAALVIFIIVTDWLDGYLARRLQESTMLGSVLDIAGDRVVETVLWIVLADLRLVPVWIPIVVISRDVLTDSIRSYVFRFGFTAFGQKTMMRTPLGRFLTGSPWMRTAYAILKAVTFSWLLAVSVLDRVPSGWWTIPSAWITTGFSIGYWLAVCTATICLIRGIPVIIEGIALIHELETDASSRHHIPGH